MMPPATTTNQKQRLLATILALCGTFNIATLAWLLWQHPFFNQDFLGFWSYPRFSPVDAIYNPGAMMRFQQALYPGFRSFFPFSYPPDMLQALSWMRHLGFNGARDLWLLAGLAALTAGAFALFRGQKPGLAIAALLASPAALFTLATGQSAFFFGGLLLGGLACLPRRPLFAGLCFGLLTLKPQLGLLLPFLLLALGAWRAIIMACLTTAALVALSCAILPPDLWLKWLTALPVIQYDHFAGHTNLTIMISPAATLLRFGVPLSWAMGCQLAITLLVAGLVFRAARNAPYPMAVAILLTGTLLAQPHAYTYDSITVPAVLMLWLLPHAARWQLGLAAALYLSPLMLFSPLAGGFVYAPLLALLFAVLCCAPHPENYILTPAPRTPNITS